jgi:LL-diaminopimelate aminotransferase
VNEEITFDVDYYLKNVQILKAGLETAGLECYGGSNNPFIWVKTHQEMSSWQCFEYLLYKTGVVSMPGSLFGSNGDGYLRLATFGSREQVEGAVENVSTFDWGN